jgi:tetratricopeptide (TPR) repeat protein
MTVLLFAIIILLTSSSHAQDTGRKDYWLKKYGEVTKGRLVGRSQEVFQRVLAASDRRAGVEPGFYVVNYELTPWAQSLSDGSVLITKNALEFCYKGRTQERGDARLAFVIGHELAHQFNGDFWHYRFLRTARNDKEGKISFQDINEIAKNPDLLLSKEIQADQYGVIYATLAGYRCDEIISKDRNFFLEWLQKSNPELYSSKGIIALSEKRAKAVALRLKEVSEKTVLFQLGVISYNLGHMDDALGLFTRFASYFPGREVYSNIGVIYLRKAYESFVMSRTRLSFPYKLSFGIDLKTRAESIPVARGFSEERYGEYKKNVQSAIEYLKKAAEYDPFYHEAKNNLGCAYVIENKYYEAVSTLEDALKPAPNNKRIQNNLAVAYSMLGREIKSDSLKEKADKLLASAKEGDEAAVHNWNVLKHARQKDEEMAVYSLPSERQDYRFEYGPRLNIATGAILFKKDGRSGVHDSKYFFLVDEMQSSGNSLKIFQVKGKSVYVLTRDDIVRLVLYKGVSGLKADLKGAEGEEVYTSNNAKNGVVVSRNRMTDYFEF